MRYYGKDGRFSEGFCANTERLCFIRRVLMLLIFALLLLFAHVALLLVASIKSVFNEAYWIAFVAMTIYISTCLLLACTNQARNCFPWNFILYLVLIESLALSLMVLGSYHGMEVMLIAFACEILVLAIMVIIGFMVPVDYTKWTAFIFILFLLAFSFAFGVIINEQLVKFSIISVVIALGIDIFLSLGMLVVFQILFNGSVFELYPDDWILGATLMFAKAIIGLMCCLKFVGFDTDD